MSLYMLVQNITYWQVGIFPSFFILPLLLIIIIIIMITTIIIIIAIIMINNNNNNSNNNNNYCYFFSFCCTDLCPPNAEYIDCGPACIPTCMEPSTNCSGSCISGCFCKPGFVFKGRHCVPLEKCGCLDDKNNYYEVRCPSWYLHLHKLLLSTKIQWQNIKWQDCNMYL